MEFVVGSLVVGIACVLLAVIVIGPSRRLRAESKMPIETQVRLLLGLTEETGEMHIVRVDDGPTPFDTAQFTALRDLAESEPEASSGAA